MIEIIEIENERNSIYNSQINKFLKYIFCDYAEYFISSITIIFKQKLLLQGLGRQGRECDRNFPLKFLAL